MRQEPEAGSIDASLRSDAHKARVFMNESSQEEMAQAWPMLLLPVERGTERSSRPTNRVIPTMMLCHK
jgi:hypothetical protein